MLKLTGYQPTHPIYVGSRTLVYRSTRLDDGRGVIVKVLRKSHPTFNELVHFRNQYLITRHLDHPNIVRPLALERYNNGYALVMPDEGAIALGDYWQQGDRSLAEFFDVALQLTEALHYLNQQHIIHKDLKPNNILIHPETRQVKLIDFSISTLLKKEQQQLSNPNVLEGTLAYLSPEQTGRMNRGVDYRTDFYSLGVTFFELLTGELPFVSEDPMEVVHCHIAKSLNFPDDRPSKPIPKMLQAIVGKLMAKNAEDRYQSGLGLKYDLEKCQQEFNRTGQIFPFALAECDRSDRFLIPEKLYGREREVQTLLDAFDRVADGTTEITLVAGFSGIGKTAVINEIHKPIVKQRGYFIKGKFDQFNRNIPFSGFVQAFRDLMGQLLGESDSQLAIWKTKILDALGENAQVIIDVVPELEIIIGPQPSVLELSASAAQNRFNVLLGNFVRVFATREHPLVLFLDDLQWADSASLTLLDRLVNESESGYLLVLGAYRDNEVFPTHPLMMALDEIRQAGATLHTLTLLPLTEVDLARLVADTLLCSREIAAPLSALIYQNTQGNPFFATQFLKRLYEEGAIAFEPDLGYWQCDWVRSRELAVTDDVVAFMVERLQKLPPPTQEVLKLAACIGNSFDLTSLAVVCERPAEAVAVDLWTGLQEEFVLPKNEIYKFFQGEPQEGEGVNSVTPTYRFLHDRVQQAAYSLIPEEEKALTHLKIGQLLLGCIPENEREENIFAIVGQLNVARQLIEEENEREKLAQLNLTASRKAIASTAYAAALEYTQIGIELLPSRPWEEQYELTLALHELATEASYLSGDWERIDRFAREISKHTHTVLERLKLYEIELESLTARGQLAEAIASGLAILAQVGVELPENPDDRAVGAAFESVSRAIGDRSPAQLLDLPEARDPNIQAAARIWTALVPPTYLSRPRLYIVGALKQVELAIASGHLPESPFTYACYGMLLCGLVGDRELGFQFGQVALDLLARQPHALLKGKTLQLVYTFTRHWKRPLRESLPALKTAYVSCVEVGDLGFAGYPANTYAYYAYYAAQPLASLATEIAGYVQALEQFQQHNTLLYCQIVRQAVLNWMGESDCPTALIGSAYDEREQLAFHESTGDRSGLALIWIQKLILSYGFGEFEQGRAYSQQARQYLDALIGFIHLAIVNFYESLTLIALLRQGEVSDREAVEKQIASNQEQLKEWATQGPMNFQHKFDLVEAERMRLEGCRDRAIESYDRAIAGAKTNRYIQEEALGNELAAQFYLEWAKEAIAAEYMQHAYSCYAYWGAKAKTDRLERDYPDLLQPVLQRAKLELNPSNSLEGLTHTLLSTTHTHNSSTGLSDSLDLASLLKAAQTLSRTIELDQLLCEISQIILTNAGAQKVALLIPQEEIWHLRAMAELTDEGTVETDTRSQPLTVESPVPSYLIHYVKNTQKVVAIDEAKTDISGIVRGYLLERQPQSVLCVPLLNQGKLIAILYLEHPIAKGVFTPDRQQVVKFLCTQAAIALQNAQLYRQAQEALTRLQQAQLQIVQSEKMSALGNLVAGVAHEINNPTGFLQGNIKPAQEYVSDLMAAIDYLLQKVPANDPEIAEKLEEFDLEFIREDLPKLLESMHLGIDRIRSISKSLRTFSRQDREQKIKFNLHEGIESTLLILKHRTKANKMRPAIDIVKEYRDLPEIQCFAGQINQVFMNILANAIDALEEGCQGKDYAELKANPNRITIRTYQVDRDRVQIEIEDNGSGMKPETQRRVFDHSFTTKEVGKGTGLGMAIAHQIITEQHGGTICCDSTLGRGTVFTITLPIEG
ncbi:MAG: GAF domain-containing protein [Cyanobacteria bacterium J007]|nr:MAG: GAF domain-containing protein [Cyanobacteria bacterium J007]